MSSGRPVARVIIADDHELARTGLRGMLTGEPDLEVVGEASTGQQAVSLCRRLRPDVALMDVRMPELDGLAATRIIKEESPATAVVMVTMHENPEYLLEALRAGAAGYVLKDATHEDQPHASILTSCKSRGCRSRWWRVLMPSRQRVRP